MHQSVYKTIRTVDSYKEGTLPYLLAIDDN